MGVSLKTGREISDVIGESFGVSARLGLMAALIAVVAGLVLGSIAALCRGKWPDRIIIFITTLFVSVPSFVLATILLLVFCLQLKWVGVWSTSNPNYVLPVLSLAMYPMAYITRLTKSSMLDVLGQDYIRTARAKGVKDSLVIFKHALRNALIPIITIAGTQLGDIFTGSILIESIFAMPGMGKLLLDAINARDLPLIQGGVMYIALICVVVYLVVDILYGVADPRIRLGEEAAE